MSRMGACFSDTSLQMKSGSGHLLQVDDFVNPLTVIIAAAFDDRFAGQ